MDHKLRYEAWTYLCNDELIPERLAEVWLQSDMKSLIDLYVPCGTKDAICNLSQLDLGFASIARLSGFYHSPVNNWIKNRNRKSITSGSTNER